ncbi:MAG TPA: hypothetical protein VMI93_07785 [Candidatus Solibacter sp.]|nr:hypothetical protein [Candidatus Solibacter sp.]
MDTPVLEIFNQNKLSHVGIQQHLETKQTTVTRETFHVSEPKKERCEWFCLESQRDKGHKHSAGCFTVRFNKGDVSPFQSAVFTSNEEGYACSDRIVVPGSDKIYKYSVEVNGKEVLDPGGAVDP